MSSEEKKEEKNDCYVKPTEKRAKMLRGSIWYLRRFDPIMIDPIMIEREAKRLSKIARLSEPNDLPNYPGSEETGFAESILRLPSQNVVVGDSSVSSTASSSALMSDDTSRSQLTTSSSSFIIPNRAKSPVLIVSSEDKPTKISDELARTYNAVQLRDAFFDKVLMDSADDVLRSVEDDVLRSVNEEDSAQKKNLEKQGAPGPSNMSSGILRVAGRDNSVNKGEFHCSSDVFKFYASVVEDRVRHNESPYVVASNLARDYAEGINERDVDDRVNLAPDRTAVMQEAWNLLDYVADARKKGLSVKSGVRQALQKRWRVEHFFKLHQACDLKDFNVAAEKFLRLSKLLPDKKSSTERETIGDDDGVFIWVCLYCALRGGFKSIALKIVDFLKESASSVDKGIAAWVESVVDDSSVDKKIPQLPKNKSEPHFRDYFKEEIYQLASGMECKEISDYFDVFWSSLVSHRELDEKLERTDTLLPFLHFLFSMRFTQALKYLWDVGEKVQAVHFGLALHAIGQLNLLLNPLKDCELSSCDIFVLSPDGKRSSLQMNFAVMLFRFLRECVLGESHELDGLSRLCLCVSYIAMLGGESRISQEMLLSLIVTSVEDGIVTPEECYGLNKYEMFQMSFPDDMWNEVLDKLKQRKLHRLWLSLKERVSPDSSEEIQSFVAEELEKFVCHPQSDSFEVLFAKARQIIDSRAGKSQPRSGVTQKLYHLLQIGTFYDRYQKCQSDSDPKCFSLFLSASQPLFQKSNDMYVVSLPQDVDMLRGMLKLVVAALETLTQCVCKGFVLFRSNPSLALSSASEDDEKACVAIHKNLFHALREYASHVDKVSENRFGFRQIIESQMRFIFQSSSIPLQDYTY